MIVAPLSVPILGAGLGIATGNGGLVTRSLVTVALGGALVVALGFVFAQFLPNPADVLSNTQVVGRTSPTLIDLTAAFATGLVGVIALARRDVGDVLPGVAIAISLVPPLAVVGVCLGSGAPGLALGAFVLFASNVVAMIVTAVGVIILAGYPGEAGEAGEAAARRGRSYLVLAVALVLVVAPITVNSLSTLWADRIADATRQWLAPYPGAQVTDVILHGGTATVKILAPQNIGDVQSLQRSVDGIVPWNPRVVLTHVVGSQDGGAP